MSMLLASFTVAFAACCVWLTVRIFNRRERWAKWTLAAVVGLPVLYVASFGPVCWITSRLNYGSASVPIFYRPICLTLKYIPYRVVHGVRWYASALAAEGWSFGMLDFDDWTWQYTPPFIESIDSRIR